ncbi:MAG: hypothetical protein JWM00_26 [Candidatus Saccharibacteria bacterium]|nr:hypothetical protein [Candidatus Saccharibacteria bacterium]
MNTRFISSLKHLFADRAVLAFILAISVFGIVYIVYVISSLQIDTLPVTAHYSAFGETHYYRNKWYYLITFAVFGLVFVVAHIGILIKLVSQELRPLALAFGWLSLIVLSLLFILTHSVLGIAF